MTAIRAEIAFRPAHFNPRCGANIPARWTVDLIGEIPSGAHVYSDGCQTRAEAIADFIVQLKRHGVATGTLKLVNVGA